MVLRGCWGLIETCFLSVGRLLVGAIQHPVESRNRALKVNSFTTTPKEILAEFEKQTGGEKWSVSYTSLEELKKVEEEKWAAGDASATGLTLRRIWASGGTLYDHRDNESIGVTKTGTLSESVAAAIARAQT